MVAIPELTPTPTEPATPSAPAAEPSPAPASAFESPEDIAFRAAQAAVAAEDAVAAAAPAATPPAPPAPAAPAAASAPGAPAAAAPAAREPMIPRERFDEVIGVNNTLKDQVAYLTGQLDALAPAAPVAGKPAAPAVAPAPAQTEFDQKLAGIQTAREALATQFEDADISATQYAVKLGELNDQAADLRIERATAKITSDMEARLATSGKSYLDGKAEENHAVQLEAANPWIGVITDAELARIQAMVHADARAEGKPFTGATTEQNIRFRTAVSEMAAMLGPKWHPDKVAEVQSTIAARTAPAVNGNKPTPAQRRAALETAARHPPDASNLGRPAANGVTGPTAAQIATMSDIELEGLSPAARSAFMN